MTKKSRKQSITHSWVSGLVPLLTLIDIWVEETIQLSLSFHYHPSFFADHSPKPNKIEQSGTMVRNEYKGNVPFRWIKQVNLPILIEHLLSRLIHTVIILRYFCFLQNAGGLGTGNEQFSQGSVQNGEDSSRHGPNTNTVTFRKRDQDPNKNLESDDVMAQMRLICNPNDPHKRFEKSKEVGAGWVE